MSKPQKLLTQTAFDDAVIENIVDLEMEAAEAVDDAKKQFEIQAYDLSTIITDLYLAADTEKLKEDRIANRPKHKIVIIVEELRSLCESQIPSSGFDVSEETKSQLSALLNSVSTMCCQHPGNRFLAFEARFESCFIQLARLFVGNPDKIAAGGEFLRNLLDTFAYFAKAQAPLLSSDALKLLVELIETFSAVENAADRYALLTAGFQCVSVACEFSESNKAALCKAGACKHAAETLEFIESKSNVSVSMATTNDTATGICKFINGLLKQDDANAIEQTQERALELVERGAIRLLIAIAKDRFGKLDGSSTISGSESDLLGLPKLLFLIYTTLSAMCIRSEYCEQVASYGALELAFNCLNWCLPSDQSADQPSKPKFDIDSRLKVLNGCMVLLRALSANDSVKAQIVADCPLAFAILLHVADCFTERAVVCGAAFALLGTLCLRSPSHVQILMERIGELNVADSAVRALKMHISRARTIKAGSSVNKSDLQSTLKVVAYVCTFVRNAVARNREYCDAFLRRAVEGARDAEKPQFVPTELEQLLNEALALNPSDLELVDAAKSALRDLGCRVELRECWTGKRSEIPR